MKHKIPQVDLITFIVLLTFFSAMVMIITHIGCEMEKETIYKKIYKEHVDAKGRKYSCLWDQDAWICCEKPDLGTITYLPSNMTYNFTRCYRIKQVSPT